MMQIEISGIPTLCIEHLVLDDNGTIAINDALDALLRPNRLITTLRN